MDVSQVTSVLHKYFDAFYEADTNKLSQLFHKASHIYGHNENGDLDDMDKETFLKIIGSFSPNSKNLDFIRNDEILAINFISDKVATARVKLRFSNLACTDIINLIYLNGEWKVISVLDTKEFI